MEARLRKLRNLYLNPKTKEKEPIQSEPDSQIISQPLQQTDQAIVQRNQDLLISQTSIPSHPQTNVASRHIISIQSQNKQPQIFEKRIYEKQTDNGPVKVEEWKQVLIRRWSQLSQSMRDVMILQQFQQQQSESNEVIPSNKNQSIIFSDSSTKEILKTNNDMGIQKTSQTSVNLFGIQNTQLSLNIQDLFGLGLLSTAHTRLLNSLPTSLRFLILLLEFGLLFLIGWQLMRMIDFLGVFVYLIDGLVKEGIFVVEQTIGNLLYGVRYLFGTTWLNWFS